MNEIHDDSIPGVQADAPGLAPLAGEPGIPDVAARSRFSMSRKGLLAVGLLGAAIVSVVAFSIVRLSGSGRPSEQAKSRLAGDRPAAATAQARKLDLTTPAAPASAAVATGSRVPALIPTEEEMAEPIGVRRTSQGSPAGGGSKSMAPEDAPVLLVSSRTASSQGRPGAGGSVSAEALSAPNEPDDPLAGTARNLQAYQRQLQALLDTLTRSTALATGQDGRQRTLAGLPGVPLGAQPNAVMAAVGGSQAGSSTQANSARLSASMLGNRSLTLPKGTAFTCALKTKVISATSGLVGCQVQRNVFSDDGRVLLIERGSHLDGEYRITSVKPGTVRIPVVWTRIRTPLGVTIDIDSPGTGPLGEAGIDGYVDNRWGERIGAAMLLSLIDDSVKMVIQNQASDTNANTVILPSTTANTSKLAEKVLDSTINIPPLIYQNQGGIVGIYVAHDVDFSSVYELKPAQR